MALGHCTMVSWRLAAVWFPLLFSSLLWQKIHAIPSCPGRCSCPGINEVHCTFRRLTSIPKTFPKDTSRLNLGYNSLTEVEGSEFRMLRQLEMLMLHGNDITTVHPGAFYNLRSLQILKFSYNKLTSVNPGLFEGLVGLIRLHLDHNLIDFIEPYSFSGLTSLKLLQLEGNLLKEIHPHTFITLSLLGTFWTSGLKHLHLSDNLLDQLPAAALNTAPRLEILSLHGNPWICDCQLNWLVEWSATHKGVIKCKKERGLSETCPQCSSPQTMNGTLFLGQSPEKLSCERPSLRSPLKQWNNPMGGESETEPDLPYTRDFEKPLGQIIIVLSDSHANSAQVACDVRHPENNPPMTWIENPVSPGELSINVSLVTILECEIDRETLQNLWQLVAYYYESPAILDRGQQKGNESRVTYQYAQVVNENSPYFTDLKGYLVADPSWLLQPRVTLRLNRQLTTSKKLVMEFSTDITKQLTNYREHQEDNVASQSWTLIHRSTAQRIQTALEGSKVHLECSVVTSNPQVKVEWILPDLSIIEDGRDDIKVSEKGELVFLNATLSDSGLYHCMIRENIGVDLMSLRLTIIERSLSPTAFNGQKIVIERGNSLSLPCEISSVQPSQTMWYLPRKEIVLPTQKMRGVEVMENGTLVVRRLTQEDAGEYSCVASNLHGVDTLSHMVEVVGGKESDRSSVRIETGQEKFSIGVEEGSGVDYQEILGPFATQVPTKVRTRTRKPNGFSKRLRSKNSKTNPSYTVKTLNPNHWANGKAKPSTAPTTDQSLPELNTVAVLTSVSTSPFSFSITDSLPHTSATPDTNLDETDFTNDIKAKTEAYSTNMKLDNGKYSVISETPPPAGSTEPTTQPISEKSETVIDANDSQPVNRSKYKHSGERRRNYNFSPHQSNWRRMPYRRRKPPMRRVRPHSDPYYHSSKSQTAFPPTTSTTLTTMMTTTITTTTRYVPTIEENHETLSAEIETAEDPGELKEEYDDQDSRSLDAMEDLIKEPSHTTNNIDSSLSTFLSARGKNLHVGSSLSNYNLSNPSIATIPELDNTPHPRERSDENSDFKRQRADKRLHTSENNRDSKNAESETETVTAMKRHENHKLNTEDSEKEITQKDYKEDNEAKVPEIHHFPIMQPVHPWLHQKKQGGGQTISSKMTHTTRNRNAGSHSEVNPERYFSSPTIPPISRWPTHHHQNHYFPIYPSRSSQKTFPHLRQGPGSPPDPTRHPWPLSQPWTQNQVVTNQPEISAETAVLIPTVSGLTGSSRITLSRPNLSHHQQNHQVDLRMQTRDSLFLTKLRNRYRQAQLDRLAQLGITITTKPRTSYRSPPSLITSKPNLSSLSPYTPRSAAPTTFYSYTSLPSKYSKSSSSSSSSSSSDSNLIPHLPPPTTAKVLRGRQLPAGEQISSQLSTNTTPFPKMWEAESRGLKPRITTLSTASVSVLAESDVFLHCKAMGNPEPHMSWTKVSTGATIPANTKHGPRFEVFRNATFVIRNIQLQDRGQYLCTAQNRFGADRSVITLAVQTEAPRIHVPKSTEIVVYLGKSVTLDCYASGKPPAQISWILPDRTFLREVGTRHTVLSPMSLLENGTLQIHSPNFSSKGDYKCIASNAAGADTVTYHLRVAALPPSISEGVMDTVMIQSGRSLYIHCSVKGEPEPALKWMLPVGMHIKPSQFLGHRLFVFPNGTLYVKAVLPADSGRYECLASNAVGMTKRTVLLEVRPDSTFLSHQPPASLPMSPTHRHVVPSRQHSVSAMYGSAVYLHCPESTGSKRGTIWQLPSKIFVEHRYSPERPIKVFRNGTLRILKLSEVDGGNYLCVFQRPNGEDMELFQVDVLMAAPRIEHVRTAQMRVAFGENFQVDCVATGLPDPDVSWSLPDGTVVNNVFQLDNSGLRSRRYVIFGNGTLLLQQMSKKDEGDYTCRAKNKLGFVERKVRVNVEPNAPKIRLKSQSLVTVKLGESVTLSCEATGEPPPKIMWISPRNEVITTSTAKFQTMHDGLLVVKNVRLADEGKYACVAQNVAGDDVKNVRVDVELQQPSINGMHGKSSTKVLAVSYQTVLLDCRVEGKPEPRIRWVTPYGHSLQIAYLGGRFQVHQNGSLELRGLRKTDKGRYVCLAKNDLGEATLLVELDVASLAEKPSFAAPNIEILPIKEEGGLLSLECPARGKPYPDFTWILPNRTILTPGVRLHRFTHHVGNGTLQISQPVASDTGVYRCLAKNVAGQAEKQYALEAGRKPAIRGSSGRVKITFGLNLNLPCIVDGWPKATITWTLPNGLVLDKPQNIGRISFLNNGTLQLRQVAPFDKGTYVCKASNSFGSSTLSYPVAVMVFPPRITNTLTSITRVNRGTQVKLSCVATGIPKPDISWTLPGRTTLVSHNRFTMQGGIYMTEEGSLVIQNPVLMNSGIYKCNAKNPLGTDFKATYLQVV
ncbi:matrix-remodeling-associated protein 5 [Antennarius striatus]|uniref:matrix-remodeling-associated protein 5 n=1 Tax=Antennarius striatus TaxID=241820 RepID=UPI0035AE3292